MSDASFAIQPADIDSVVRKLKNAPDNYSKMEVFEEFGVDWVDRPAALWELVRRGEYDAWNDPAIWSELIESIEHATAQDLVTFLARVEQYDAQAPARGAEIDAVVDPEEDEYYEDEDYDDEYGGGGYEEPPFESQRLVSFWPVQLDAMAMHAYAMDAALVEASEFHPDVQKGLQLVRRRFGVISREELPESTVSELATTHVWRSLPWYTYEVVAGAVERVEIGRHDAAGAELKRQFIRHFTDDATWAQAVLDAIFLESYGPNFQCTLEAWPLADHEQLERMLRDISIYNQDRVTTYELLLARDDSPADLVGIAQRLDADSRWGQAEMSAVAAVLRARALGETPPPEALPLISFRCLDSPYKRTDTVGVPPLVDALHAFAEDDVVARFLVVFDGEYTKTEPFLALNAYPHREDLLARAFAVAETIAEGDYASFNGMNKVAIGLALLGPDALGPISDAFDASPTPLVRDTYRRAILGILADADGPQDPSFDRFVSLLDFEDPQTTDSDLLNYVSEDYRAALAKMGDRAPTRMARDLDATRPGWERTLVALRTVRNPEVLDKAFGAIANHGLPPNRGADWLGQVLSDCEIRPELEPFISPALAAAKSPDFHNVIKRQFGEERYAAMLAAAGAEAAADAAPADKIRRLAEALFATRPNLERTLLYVFSRTNQPPSDGSLNRIGGRPFGVTAETWPCKDADEDQPMTHVLTLDIDAVPGLRRRYQDDVRAFSLFLRTPGSNQAWSPGNGEAEVVVVNRDAAAEFAGSVPAGDDEAVGFTVEQLEVPLQAWTVGYKTDPELEALKSAVYSLGGWVGGGGPMWLQGDDHFGFPLMQFDESFAYVNLGDMGIMYVFDDTAFWQCH